MKKISFNTSILAGLLGTTCVALSCPVTPVTPPADPVPNPPVVPAEPVAPNTPNADPDTPTETPAVPPKAEVVPDETVTPTPDPAPPVPVVPQPVREAPTEFVPLGGTRHLLMQADIDLFTKGKAIGHVQNNESKPFRRLVQRTIMPTEPRPTYGAVLTFDDQLVGDSPASGSAIDVAKDLAPLNARAIFFANVNALSETDLRIILRKHSNSAKRLKACQELLDSRKEIFVKTIRSLIKVQGPADQDGNKQYTCDVFNHTVFHQDMSRLKVGTDKFNICLLGIDFIEQCLDEAYEAERPGWERARYFRFPFLHTPKDKATQIALNEKFTELGLIAVGETQDSKDVDNYSHRVAYKSLAAAKKNRRYNPKYGIYGRADQPIALFHTKTWKKIKPGVIKAIKEQ